MTISFLQNIVGSIAALIILSFFSFQFSNRDISCEEHDFYGINFSKWLNLIGIEYIVFALILLFMDKFCTNMKCVYTIFVFDFILFSSLFAIAFPLLEKNTECTIIANVPIFLVYLHCLFGFIIRYIAFSGCSKTIFQLSERIPLLYVSRQEFN